MNRFVRYLACMLVVVVLFSVYIVRLVDWQLIQGKDFAKQALNQVTSYVKLPAARGEILDRSGKVLAGNKPSYTIVCDALEMDYSKQNETIIKVISMLDSREEEWNDTLPIELDSNGNYAFKEDQDDDIEYLKSRDLLDLQSYATADDCMRALVKYYDAVGYSKEDTRKLVSVRYAMLREQFGRSNQFVLASDVSAETIGVISERSGEIPGVGPGMSTIRYYGKDGALAPHIVGTIGAISAEQYQAEKDNKNTYKDIVTGYALNDVRGQSGIESVFESTLRGDNGKRIIIADNAGKVEDSSVTETPKAGDTVYLTLDSKLQERANKALEKNILASSQTFKDCTAGAAVVLDVKNFGVLASATYPNFDLNKYVEDRTYYSQLVKNENKPLFNRALDGTFLPGSIFKPYMATVALNEGVVSLEHSVACDGKYRYYTDYQPGCLGVHGSQSLLDALSNSCNVYFYDTGRRLGIDKIGAYSEYFALGTKTGVELSEAKGQISDMETFLRLRPSEPWTGGNTLQASIGQMDNLFTPIQLATYCATIVNNGSRLQTHFLDKITDYSKNTLIEKYENEVLSDPEISESIFSTVKVGMRQVVTSGTSAKVFSNYGVSVAGKTGTAETPGKHSDNLTFIGFAPYEDPKIAVAVVIEYGGKGDFAMNVAKEIFDEYFGLNSSDEDNTDAETGENETGTEGSAGSTDQTTNDPENPNGDSGNDTTTDPEAGPATTTNTPINQSHGNSGSKPTTSTAGYLSILKKVDVLPQEVKKFQNTGKLTRSSD